MTISGKKITLKEINQQNSAFWKTQQTLMEKRLSNDIVLDMAVQTINSNREVNLHIKLQMPFEVALDIADHNFEKIKKSISKKGGEGNKADALQKHILELVQLNPKITSSQLLDQLASQKGSGLIEDIDEDTILFLNQNDRLKNASVYGLKDRLSRAKKKLNSR